jgi:xanthine dehydrogenase accessory factor
MTAGDWSVPRTEVLNAVGEAIDGGAAVLATVVAVEGSAYRRPGAKMIVADEGDGVGSITAGCLEDEVLALAEQVLADGRPRVERFDLTGDDDVWGLGVGCNGVIDILLEPLTESYRPVVDAYDRGEDVAVLTVLDGGGTDLARGDRAFAFPTGRDGDERDIPDYKDGENRDRNTKSGFRNGQNGDGLAFEAGEWPTAVLETLAETTARLLAADTSDSVTVEHDGETVEVFVDSVTAPPELVVFGGGHDVAPVAELAAQVDFRVTVATFRGAVAEESRFPAADRVCSTSPADIRATLSFDTDTYAVVMSHNFVDDRLALAELLETPVEYIGLLGPRKRFAEMREAFADEGRTFDDDELERIYTPAGLNLGGGTPFHIAQSIVAEVTAVHHGRDPAHLSERTGPIHTRSPLDDDPGGEATDTGADEAGDAE